MKVHDDIALGGELVHTAGEGKGIIAVGNAKGGSGLGVSQVQIVESIVAISSAKKSLGWMPECNLIPVKCALKAIVTELTDTHQISIVQVSVCMCFESIWGKVLEG